MQLIVDAAGDRIKGSVLENGCGVGIYVKHLAPYSRIVVGLEYDIKRASSAGETTLDYLNAQILCAAGENLPLQETTFDLILSHEVLEHVVDDRKCVLEMIRTLRPGGRMILFVPNRGYPFETHGVFWRGRYHFGNIPLVNYLPEWFRVRLVPHVRVYSPRDLEALFSGLPVRYVKKTTIFGAYDNVIARWPRIGRALRSVLQWLEKTPFRVFGLSHFWVLEKL